MLKIDRSKLLTNLGKKYRLIPYIEKAFVGFDDVWEYKYEKKEHDDAWHPSSHCTLEVSELYEVAQGTYEDPLTEMEKNFQVGHFWHQLLQYIVLHKVKACAPESIERRGWLHWGPVEEFSKEDLYFRPDKLPVGLTHPRTETSVLKPLPYHWSTGSGDVAPILFPDGWEGVLDFKTMSSHQFKQVQLPDWCAAKYEAQINMYMEYFDLDKGMIFTINKDTPHGFKEYEFERNQPLIDEIKDRWLFVSEALDEGLEITQAEDEMWLKLDAESPLLTGPMSV